MNERKQKKKQKTKNISLYLLNILNRSLFQATILEFSMGLNETNQK